jgi:site-specific DNA-methyltransferase (adenine-specific)
MWADKKYNIIYADPPWYYKNNPGFTNIAKSHYDLMKTDDICKIPVSEIAEKDCALFIWTTDSHLPDAIRVIDAWGFTYKTIAFWWLKKEISGKQVCYMGHWTMKCGEICLFATLGKMKQHLKNRKIRCLTEAIREKHSAKPNIIREKIKEMFPLVPKIELFAREKAEGWDSWGNEL